MNDLAEKALHALNVAQAGLRGRPVVSLATGGFVASAVVVLAGSRAAAADATGSITTWFGLLPPGGRSRTAMLAGTVTIAGLLALCALWVAAVVVLRTAGLTERAVWTIGAAWGAPFLVGPPLMDTHVYVDVARGLLQRAGHDPYAAPVSRLGHAQILGVIDPSLHDLPSATGPLATVIQHLSIAASGAHLLGAVVLLRLVALVAVISIGRNAADLVGARRSQALVLTVLNPLLLVYVLSACHLDGLAAALGVAALVSANQRRWIRAILFASLAASVLPVFLVEIAVIVVVHALGRRGKGSVLSISTVVGRDVGEAAAITVAIGLAVPNGFGWVDEVHRQFSDYVPYAPSNLAGRLIGPIVRVASFDDLAAAGRVTAIIAAVCVVGYLLVSARYRPVDHTAGYALLAIALLAPDVYPWFLVWGIACLAPTVTGMRRFVVMVLSCTAVLLMPPGFSDHVRDGLGFAAIGIGALVLAGKLYRERPPAPALSADERRSARRVPERT